MGRRLADPRSMTDTLQRNPNATAHIADPSPDTGARWYALRCRSRQEFAVKNSLQNQSVEQFLPTYRESVRWSDRETVTERPLFTGYIFARFHPGNRSPILQTRGVVTILSIDQYPEPISDSVISDLKRAVDSAVPCSPCAYVVGEQVTVEKGTWAGCTGVVTRVKGVSTLWIPVEILGRSVPVPIDPADVKRTPKEKS